jgi:MazG family protein
MKEHALSHAFHRLVRIMETLRSAEGCPWDREQTPESLKPYLLEEAYEVLDALDQTRPTSVRDELGDLLLQVVFLARIFEERGKFDIEDVATAIADKLERRHPHVFGSTPEGKTVSHDVQWETIKKRERAERGEATGVLAGVPRAFPALLRARKLSEKAARVGFDWEDARGVWKKVHEEMTELEEAMSREDRAEMEHELGDVLFAVANLGRFLKIDAEEALRRTCNRFVARFEHIERCLDHQGNTIQETALEKLDALWEQAKALEKIPAPGTAKI